MSPKKGTIHTHSCLPDCVSGHTTTTLRDYENNIS